MKKMAITKMQIRLVAVFVFLSFSVTGIATDTTDNEMWKLSPEAMRVLNNELLKFVSVQVNVPKEFEDHKEREEYRIGVVEGWSYWMADLGKTIDTEMHRQTINLSLPIRLSHEVHPSWPRMKGFLSGKHLMTRWESTIRSDMLINSRTNQNRKKWTAFIQRGYNEEKVAHNVSDIITKKREILFESSPSLEAFMFLYEHLSRDLTSGHL